MAGYDLDSSMPQSAVLSRLRERGTTRSVVERGAACSIARNTAEDTCSISSGENRSTVIPSPFNQAVRLSSRSTCSA